MNLDTTRLGSEILGAFSSAFRDKWPEIKTYGESEARKLAESIVMIEKLRVEGKINEEQARLHIAIQKNSARMVFLTLEGMGLLAVEKAINDALGAVKNAVNTALGFALI